MRGKVFAVRGLLLLTVLALGATSAAAEDAAMPAPGTPSPANETAVIVLDASKSMNGKVGSTPKIDTARAALAKTIAAESGKRALGLVAFGTGKGTSCADTEALAEPGALEAASAPALLEAIKPKGKAPVAAAIGTAVMLAAKRSPLNIVLIADGGDTCDADPCATAQTLKEQRKDLRIHVVGLSDKPDDIQPLACVAQATGGKFVAATNEAGFGVALGAVFAAIDARSTPVIPPPVPMTAAPPAQVAKSGPSESAVLKSGSSSSFNTAESIIQISPPAPMAAPPAEPVPVSFHALITEGGPRLQSGLIWRIYNAGAKTDNGFELVSTHREAAPATSLPPGEYLVNAAYGLSNLTKKIEVDGSKPVNETFILNTGGLMLRAVLANGEECPEGNVQFDIQSDEQDQFGERKTILADAKPKNVIRLNAGAYHINSLYGDANANVGVDITVEPGRVTQATVKHTGAKITFRLVQSLGGEALADTQWRILTSAGDTVKSNAGALPTHILAAGNYAVVAEHDGKAYSRTFTIEPGNDKQIEVAVADGPTSPEALQALLDPPEAPQPGTGGLAGEGPGGFDGFSNSADPNAPLLNPGALLRPSR
ncbi:hypothetical protein [Methyloceanibacter sp.]|uniref:vWA domain-containing protein n=1 Tax=Methyloceanibacter sp. TaxID=1965321 RepID=UPI002CBBDEAC|nr:hypothetical protein [Methyloceanibacter sp.]HML91969.1 hypothetical protein [Methyloceanibacter sp.]